MDQGFAPQGFSATDAATIERQLAARAPHGSHIPRPTATETAGKGAISASSKARSPHLDPTQQNVARLEGVKSAFMMPAQMEFFGMLGGGALGWVTNKFGWQRATAALGMLFKAPVQALRQSSLAEFFHVPANFLKAAATEASTAGGKAQGWAESATRQAKTLEKTAKQLDGRAASVLEPIGKSVGSSVGWFERTPVGKSLHSMFDSLMHGRKAAAIAKHEAVFAKAQGAFTTEASAGWRASAGNFFSRIFKGTQPATVPAGELSSMMHGLSAAKGDHAKLKAFAGNLETLIADGALSAEAKARAGNVAKHVGKLVGSAHAMETYGSAAGGSMKTMVKAMGKAIGRVPVFNALLAVGITAGVGATMLAAKAESKEAKLAFDDLSDQLRSSDSGFLDAVKKVQKSQGMWGIFFYDIERLGRQVLRRIVRSHVVNRASPRNDSGIHLKQAEEFLCFANFCGIQCFCALFESIAGKAIHFFFIDACALIFIMGMAFTASSGAGVIALVIVIVIIKMVVMSAHAL
jgi:hypothetical protein